MRYFVDRGLMIVLALVVVSCVERPNGQSGDASLAASEADAQARARHAAELFWSTPRIDECCDGVLSLCEALRASDRARLLALTYRESDATYSTIGFEGIVIEKVTEPLRAIDTALRLCTEYAENEEKLRLLDRVDAILAGGMHSMRRDLGVDPEEFIPSAYVRLARGRHWAHGKMLEILGPDSPEAVTVKARFEILERISRSTSLNHDVP
ncbi:MAG: hypothetical protein HUU18_06710 [Phycisphaerales bacterium]|nr:hypothetical protein [Phycisphaerales bacterium]